MRVFTDRTRDELDELETPGGGGSRSGGRRRRPLDRRRDDPGARPPPATAAVQAASEALFGKGDLRRLGRPNTSPTPRLSCPGERSTWG